MHQMSKHLSLSKMYFLRFLEGVGRFLLTYNFTGTGPTALTEATAAGRTRPDSGERGRLDMKTKVVTLVPRTTKKINIQFHKTYIFPITYKLWENIISR